MKTILTILMAIACCLPSFAQEQYLQYNPHTSKWEKSTENNSKLNIETLLKSSPVIFEGKIIEYKQLIDTVRNENNKVAGNSYTVYVIQISNILKGEDKIQKGAIAIIDPVAASLVSFDPAFGMMYIGIDRAYVSPPPIMPKSGIYFCEISNHTPLGNPYPLTLIGNDNQIVLKSIFQNIDLSKLEFRAGTNEKIKFESKHEIYNFLKQFNNITIPEEEPEKKKEIKEQQPVKKKDAEGSDARTKENEIKYAQNVANYETYMGLLQIKLNNAAIANDDCKELFISEYVDGSPKNKAVEVYNPTDTAIDLSNYSIRIFNNGAPTPTEIFLSGMLAPKEVYVVANPLADAAILAETDLTSNLMNFNGNDAIVLNKGISNYVDKIGEIGVNPGNGGWFIPPGASTKAHTLPRKQNSAKGELNWPVNQNKWDAHPINYFLKLGYHNSICASAGNNLMFSYDNITETGVSPRYLEFDIMAEANNSSTYFDNCLLRIEYSTTAFGSNVVANNKVTITKGATYNSVTYIDPDANAIDQTASVMGVPFGTDFNQPSWLRTLATTVPTQILHFKIEIANCNQNSSINFTDTSFTPMFSFYTVNANDNIVNTFSYDNTLYLNSLNTLLCELKITGFTSPVYPGTWYQGTPTSEWLLIIQGNNFGATRGNGNAYFLNAKDGGQSYVPLDGYDFISWSDNEIRITMPSRIDSLPFKGRIPSSGIFYVKTNTGDSVLSGTPIDMPYAIKNVEFPALVIKKVRMDLLNVDSSDSIAITFRLDSSIANNAMIKAIVKKAVADWRCETLVYFETGADTTLTSADDGVSVIHFIDTLPAGVLAQTSMFSPILCLDNNSYRHVFPEEIDIAILRDPSVIWYFDTLGALPAGMYDFYEVIVHEVGHGNLLAHVTAPTLAGNATEIMFWAGLVGPVAEINRRWIDVEAAIGGFDVVQVSEALNINFPTCNTANTGTLILSPDQSCGELIGFEQIPSNENNVEFNLFPNPSYNGFTVTYKLTRNATVQFSLLDYMGKALKRFDEHTKAKGQYEQYIDIQNLTAGLYFLIANINGNLQTLKVIKH